MRLYDRHPATPKGLPEVGRTMRSKTFAVAPGKRKLVQTIGPLHWWDGDWQDIDLEPVRQPDGMWRVDQAAYKLIVDPTTATLRHESRETGLRARVGLKAIGRQPVTLPEPTVEDGRILWPEVVEGIDIELVLRPKGAEWFKTIKSPDAPHEFTWTVERQEGFPAERIRLETAGVDAAKDTLRMSHAVENERTDRGWIKFDQTEAFERQVSRIVDRRTRRRDWFDDPAYPVRVDQDISEPIVATTDDARSFNGWGNYTTQSLVQTNVHSGRAGRATWTSGTTVWNAGVRFQGVAIAQGSTIDLATLKLFERGTFASTATGRIYGADVDDVGVWGVGNEPKNITKTTASTAISTANDAQYNDFDVTAVVQEIINRGGWVSGNDLGFAALNTLGDTMGTAVGQFVFYDYNAGQSVASVLEIDFTASGPSIPVLYHHYRQMHGA